MERRNIITKELALGPEEEFTPLEIYEYELVAFVLELTESPPSIEELKEKDRPFAEHIMRVVLFKYKDQPRVAGFSEISSLPVATEPEEN